MRLIQYLFAIIALVTIFSILPASAAPTGREVTVFPPMPVNTAVTPACPGGDGQPPGVLAWNNDSNVTSTNCLTWDEVLALSLPAMTTSEGQLVLNRAMPLQTCPQGSLVTYNGTTKNFDCGSPAFQECPDGDYIPSTSSCSELTD